jgi:hypothetical protein
MTHYEVNVTYMPKGGRHKRTVKFRLQNIEDLQQKILEQIAARQWTTIDAIRDNCDIVGSKVYKVTRELMKP